MEEREDLNIQNTQGGSTPTNQGQDNVGASSSPSTNRVDGIVNPPASSVPTPPPTIQPARSYINPTPPAVNSVIPEVTPNIVEEPKETTNIYNAESTINTLPRKEEAQGLTQELEEDNQETEEMEDYTNPQIAEEDGYDTDNNVADLEHQPDFEDDFEYQEPINPYSCEVTDNIIPHRGTLWYVLFALASMVASAIIIFRSEWVLLVVVVISAGVLLWRGHQGKRMSLEINAEGAKIKEKTFFFDDIDNFYLSRMGENETINISLLKKYLPKLTYIFLNADDAQKVKEELDKRVPEMEQRKESYVDFLIRKLKI